MERADYNPVSPDVTQLARMEQVDSGPDYRIAWEGPHADMSTASVRLCCTDEQAPEFGMGGLCHSETITRSDCANEFALASWCRDHGAGWVVRHGMLGQVLEMLQDRWGHAQEYMARFDHANGHGRAPLPSSLRHGVQA